MQTEPIRGYRSAILILIGIMAAEGYPLVMIGLRPAGLPALAKLLGWGIPPVWPGAWLGAAAVAAAYAALSMKSLPFIRLHVLDLAPIKLLAIPFAFVTGVFEELFFRKWLMDLLATHGAGAAVQVLSSGIIFGLAHAFWGVLGRNMVAAGKAMLYTTILGTALGIVYLASGRILAPAAWSHVAINLVIEPWLMLGVMNLRRPGTAVPGPLRT